MLAKLKAFFIHLSISCVVGLLAAGLVFLFWYPNSLHKALGVTTIFLILLTIDVILGPLLTFIVFKKNKKTLIMDLAVITALQVSALAYGLWTIEQGRPAWLVFGGNHFELVRKTDIESHNLVRQPNWWGPEWVSVKKPLKLSYSIFSNSRKIEPSLFRQPKNYHPLDIYEKRISERALPFSMLEKNNTAETVKKILSKWPKADGWFPLHGKKQDMVVLMRKDNAKVVAIVDLRP